MLSIVAVAGSLLFVIVLATVLYLNRVQVLNEALARLVEPFDVTVGEIDFLRFGEVRVADLRLVPKAAPAGAVLATIPEAVITYNFEELRATRKLRSLTLRGVELTLDDKLLSALAPAEGNEEKTEEAPPFSLESLSVFTGSLRALDSRFVLELDALPRIEGTWDLRSGPLEFGEEGLGLEPLALTLGEIVVGNEGENGRIRRISARARLASDLSRIELESLGVASPRLRITPSLFAGATQEGRVHDLTEVAPESPAKDEEGLSLLVRSLAITGAQLALEGFDGSEGLPLIPDLSFETEFSTEDLRFEEGRFENALPLTIGLVDLNVGTAPTPFLSAERVDLVCEDLDALVRQRLLPSLRIENVDVLFTDSSMAWLSANGEEENTEEASDPSLPWTVGELEVVDGGFLMRDFNPAGKPAPSLSSAFSGTLRELRFGGEEGFASEGLQDLLLEQTRLQAPGAETAEEPLLSLERTELALRWSEFQRDNTLAKLRVQGPKIHFTDRSLGTWLKTSEAPSEEAPGPINRSVYKVADLEVSGGKITADSSFAEGRVPKIHADFTLVSSQGAAAAPYAYDLRLTDFVIRNHARFIEPAGPPRTSDATPDATLPPSLPPLAEGEVFRVEEITASFTADDLQRTRRIGKLKLEGAVLTVGEGLKSVAGGNEPEADAPAAEPAPPEPAVPPQAAASRDLPAWTLGEVEITRSRVQFEALIPQVEGLKFDVETRLTEVPLSLDGILAQEAMQKIELAGIEIRDPYNSFITVADLPTIFVEFSLAGLARQEVEKIDLVGPSLHVGQGLFWWIDYQRNHREANEGASIGFEDDAVPEVEQPDWVIKTINATAGKIVIAPTGVPVGVVPFPFNATTHMTGGNIELKLTIPDEDHVYRFPDYKVALEGLAGDVRFNVPVKEVDNNLVQTFTLRKARWKDFEADDLYISVTFDENGIYGQFGGAAYEGYAEGEFNFYLNDQGKWDAWLAGTDLDTGPVTAVIAPDSFLMEGRVSLKVLAEGRDKDVGETSGAFKTTTDGWFDITKLDSLFDKLPPEWSSLQRGLAELSLIALKRFEYDKGEGSLYFHGREGKLDLLFEGEYGTRALNLKVHDERNTNEKTTASTGTPTPETDAGPLPEASARPARPKTLLGVRKTP